MNYKEVLKCLKMPNYVSNDFYSMLFARSIGGGAAGYGELTGTPPLTFIANGENLLDYRIYGANDGVGERSISYGYQINAVVRSENLLNFADLMAAPEGAIDGITFPHALTVTLKPNATYSLCSNGYGSGSGESDTNRSLYFNGINPPDCVFADHPVSKATSVNGKLVIGFMSQRTNAQQYINNTAQIWLTEGSTPPAQYIPYSHTDAPIYIGDTPLAQGEYVDYSEQKVYKYVGGVLTPTDPPVALPALPTIDGTTVADFDNEPKPSEMYIKYPK